jgi:hypothetical protein
VRRRRPFADAGTEWRIRAGDDDGGRSDSRQLARADRTHEGNECAAHAARRLDVAEDFYSFEKALRELHKTEDELKKLVSEGEIRAFRDESSMKFKKEDIERYKHALGTEMPTLEAPTGELTEELFGDDSGGGDDIGMVTQQISDSSFLEEETAAPAAKPPRGSAGTRSKSRAGTTSKAGTSSGVRSAARRRAEAGPGDEEGVGIRFCLILGTLVMLFATIVAFNAAEVTPGMGGGWANFVNNTFLKP